MLRFLWWLVALPIGIVAVALAVANRRPVALALDPLAADPFATAAAIQPIVLPGYLIVLGSLAVGVLIGGIAMWLSEGRNRRDLRHWRAEARRLEREATAREAGRDSVGRDAGPRDTQPALTHLPSGTRRVA
jgi:hypothetical protein